jgi:hypothetical protein
MLEMPAVANAIRQNHALEHATMHILARGHPYDRFMGRSTAGGFLIYGNLTTNEVENAAAEALARLQQGEAHLAVHPRCGTNLAVTGVLAGTAAFVATLGRPRSRLERLPLVLAAATLAAVAAQPVAHRVQEYITTTPDLEGVHITGVERLPRGKMVVHRVMVGR